VYSVFIELKVIILFKLKPFSYHERVFEAILSFSRQMPASNLNLVITVSFHAFL
jgi:hypothetical protein